MRNKGISLIVLIITIIVIIILAGAVILNLSKNNPIDSAKQARFVSDIDSFKNELTMYILKKQTDTQGTYDSSKLSATKTSLEENGEILEGNITKIIKSMNNKYLDILKIQKGELVYIGEDDKEKNWIYNIIDLGDSTLPTSEYPLSNPAGTVSNPSTPRNVNTTINGKKPTYNNPVIPSGFSPVNTSDASWNNVSTDWNNGLVIQDSYGNQFVWVPVDGTDVEYIKWCTTIMPYYVTTDDTLPSGFSTSSITDTYKGFYIARYESAFDYNDGEIRAASKKSTNKVSTDWSSIRNSTYNGYLWNYINYIDAKKYSESMADSYGYNTTIIGTNLVTGTQWDTIMKWIQNSGKSVTDSREWGNYNNSVAPANISGYRNLQISGYSDYWKGKNIYDLAGNIAEYTSEKYSNSAIYRGGYYYGTGLDMPIASRAGVSESSTNEIIGFRVALYIK